jgi:hypothetical protein
MVVGKSFEYTALSGPNYKASGFAGGDSLCLPGLKHFKQRSGPIRVSGWKQRKEAAGCAEIKSCSDGRRNAGGKKIARVFFYGK